MANIMHQDYQHRVLEGMLTQARALNYDIAIFSLFINRDEQTAYQSGENEIFNLINFEMFDAVIYVPCSFYSNILRDKIVHMLRHVPRCPVVVLENDKPFFETVTVDDTIAYEQLVSHLIEVHHLTDILCLAGFKGNLQAEARLQGYRNAMRKHGLSIPEGRIIYGDFWTAAAEKLAKDIAEGNIPKPEAVVCACDYPAVALCNSLISLGLHVPEDLVVAGYDSTSDAADNVPSVTTFVRPLVRLGMDGILKVHKLLTGEDISPVKEEHGYLLPAESCGCGEDFMQKFKERQAEVKNIEAYRTLFENCPMAETLNACPTLNNLLSKITEFLYLIHNLEDFSICLCDQWDDFSKNKDETGSYCHYTDTMHLRILKNGDETHLSDVPFSRNKLLPQFWEDREDPIACYITPLHFNERCFGYAAIGYGKRPEAFDTLYHSWTKNINNALEFVRIRNIFNSMNQRLFKASIRDTLTGIFNRKGFNHYAPELFRKTVSSGRKLLVLAADLDGLKSINDTYGHLEGDNAISAAANALSTCFEFGEICARTGGDEFLVIGSADYTEKKLRQYEAYVQRFLDHYNSTSEKPYKVGISVGYICRTVTEADDLQKMIDEADALMYENKVKRKKNRID